MILPSYPLSQHKIPAFMRTLLTLTPPHHLLLVGNPKKKKLRILKKVEDAVSDFTNKDDYASFCWEDVVF